MNTSKFAKPIAWFLLAGLVFMTVSPIGMRPHTVTSVNLDRVLAYVAVGVAFSLAYPRRWLTVILSLIVGAIAIEYLQYLSPTRHPRFHDALVKAIGASLGGIAGCIFNKVVLPKLER
ncbi:VanZ family protein [Rhizobium sp. Root1220]|uniref:VanZ family protein n=1 Tax=Rhizobium sp. Root1220 TaxID=1736432 RepID=UPI0006F38085|nr:VanZ family protein [Rhizobium sp. Root1220]KQV83580.1 antibiotic resistance protein VanZ [Rhizobium sp. Root1220]